ncbi:hypothetical protein SCH_1350 [Salmonella enterica subsp. enterica serovar Choleraesuis str. SC-B67]|uniref:Uncharacterized protein n=1 Tax=Salmonella choleraesuis (strain SC-B67) TaxID=321314 RepID=Q57PV5_SALCH|nr:hypothetical protein SCH_1350 [Salmonella enterica subsp. enterica serovar Choleraesuis str. SC-B67]
MKPIISRTQIANEKWIFNNIWRVFFNTIFQH